MQVLVRGRNVSCAHISRFITVFERHCDDSTYPSTLPDENGASSTRSVRVRLDVHSQSPLVDASRYGFMCHWTQLQLDLT